MTARGLQERIKFVIILSYVLDVRFSKHQPESLMRFLWKLVLIVAVPLGGYWLYKKGCESSSEPRVDVGREREPDSSPSKSGERPDTQVIKQLSMIDGVTSRVARNLVEKGITSKEALMELSEEELRSVKGIGPKRAAKILNL